MKREKRGINKMKGVMNELLNSELMVFDKRRNLDNVCGIYAIYRGQKVIYIGYTKSRLKKRFQEMMADYRSHTLHNQLKKDLGSKKKVQNFLTKCKFKIKKFKDPNEAKRAEHFIIGVLNPKYNH